MEEVPSTTSTSGNHSVANSIDEPDADAETDPADGRDEEEEEENEDDDFDLDEEMEGTSEAGEEDDEAEPLISKPDNVKHKGVGVLDADIQRPLLYSENNYGILNKSRPTNHLTIECLVSVPAQLFAWDDALSGFLLYGPSLCTVNLLQQITCQHTLSPTLVQPAIRNSWSSSTDVIGAAAAMKNTLAAPNVAKVTPVWEYTIQCQRKFDTKTIVECILVPHMTYICALPTFHHWRIGDRRYALSFASDYSASKFHNRLQKALSHLSRQSKSTIAGSGESNLDATDDLDDDVFVATDSSETPLGWPRRTGIPKEMLPLCPAITPPRPPTPENNDEEEEDGFVPPLLSWSLHVDDKPPMDPESARPHLSLATVSPCVNCHKCYGSPAFLSSLTSPYDQQPSPVESASSAGSIGEVKVSPCEKDTRYKPRLVQSSSSGAAPDYDSSRGRFEKMRSIRSSSNPGSIMQVARMTYKISRDSSEMSKSKSMLDTHLRAAKEASYSLRHASFELVQRERCIHCSQWYNVKENRRGACLEAPDAVEKWIKRLTCFNLASKIVERPRTPGDSYCSSPCDSSCFQTPQPKSLRRKAIFAMLSFIFPCLCCYKPLIAAYHSRVTCRLATWCSGIPETGTPTSSTLSSSHRNRRLCRPAKHSPMPSIISQKSGKVAKLSSKKTKDHPQSSRTSSSQQMEPCLKGMRFGGDDSIVIAPEKSSSGSRSGEDARRHIRPLISRLSF